MFKALFYKEWIKLRWYMLLAVLAITGTAAYCMFNLHRAISIKEAAHIWEVMVTKNAIFVDYLKYLPLLVGTLAALVQFVPEMYRKCLKLTLHLPCTEKMTLFSMLGSGLLLVCACFAMSLLAPACYLPAVLPAELVKNVFSALAPWYLAGVAAYLLMAWVCLEPTWKLRTVNLVIAILVVRIYFMAPVPQAYNGFLPALGIYTLLLSLLSWISIIRFKAGKQD